MLPLPMELDTTFPVLATAREAYALLWRERRLHAKAVWPPILFLVAAECLYHRVMGHARGLAAHWHALLSASWYVPVGAALLWLAGLKFLLSFSISWRRHLLVGERFDPFFFRRPFWRYLALLIATYAWLLPLLLLSLVPAVLLAGRGHAVAAALVPALAFVLALSFIVRQVPYFTALTLDPPHPGWRRSVRAMRGHAARYALCWAFAMLPVALLGFSVDLVLGRTGADPHRIPVALAEAVARQLMLFVHFSLGASIGAATFRHLFGRRSLDGRPADPGLATQAEATAGAVAA